MPKQKQKQEEQAEPRTAEQVAEELKRLEEAVSYLPILPIRNEHRSCQLIGWLIPRRLPSLSLNQAPLPKRLPSLSLTSAMSLTVLKSGKSYSSNTTPRTRSHSTVASMSFTSHDI